MILKSKKSRPFHLLLLLWKKTGLRLINLLENETYYETALPIFPHSLLRQLLFCEYFSKKSRVIRIHFKKTKRKILKAKVIHLIL